MEASLKGQASFEQLLVIGIGLTIIAIMFYVGTTYTSDSLKISQAEDAAARIAGAADYVHSMGPNSKEYVEVYLPQDITNITIGGKRIVINVITSSGPTDLFATTHSDLIGALPAGRGRQKILVQYLESGKVLIGEAGLACSPSLISRVFNESGGGSDTINLSNAADFNITGITAELTGGASALASLSGAPGDLGVGENGTLTVYYNVPPGQASGAYGGVVLVQTGNDGSCTTGLNINVNAGQSCGGLCVSQGYINGTCRNTPSDCISSAEDYSAANSGQCASTVCCCGPTRDNMGPVVSSLNSTPFNASTADVVAINAVCNDSASGGFVKNAQVRIDSGSWMNMSPTDGTFGNDVVEGASLNVGMLSNGQHIAWAQCTDTAGNLGPVAYYYFNVSMADVLGPIVTFMNHTDTPTTLTNISVSGTATDVYTGGSNLKGCNMKLDSGSWSALSADDGAWDSPTENYTRNLGQMNVGYHTVFVQCTDALNNTGGIFNDSFGVVSVDMMLVIDKSGSMAWNVTNVSNSGVASTSSTSFTLVKSMTITGKNGDLGNLTAEISASAGGCTAFYEARVGSDVIASGNRTSTAYGSTISVVNISAYPAPVQIDLYMKRSAGASCNANSRAFSIQQEPSKMSAAAAAADAFVDVVTNTTNAGLVSFSTSSSLDKSLAIMSAANKTTLKNAINAISPTGSTCMECGLDTAADELTSTRGRPDATKVIIMLTDGVSNVGDPVAGSVYCRDRNITVYTIGFGDDVDDVQLTNIALLTHGSYYFAPDAETLTLIFRNIGR